MLHQGPRGADESAALDADLYWVSDTAGQWHDVANWALTTGGTGGAGIPDVTNQVTFDGEGTGLCSLTRGATCKELVFNETGAQVNANFDQSGHKLICSTFVYDCANNTSTIFDGEISVTGAAFTVTAAQNDAILASASISTSAVACTITSTDDTAIPGITALGDITAAGAMTVASLNMADGASLSMKESVAFVLTAYTVGDWDGLAAINSGSAGTAATFTNPAAMILSEVDLIKDVTAANIIDATDDCVQTTGNTNVSTTLFWIGDSAGDWTDTDVWSITSNGTAKATFPTAVNDVEFDGGGTATCTLTANAACKQLLFDDSVAQPESAFDAAGFDVSCDTFLMDWNVGDTIVFDGDFTVRGASFVVTAATAATFFASATIKCLAADVTITSTDDTNLPHIQVAGDATFSTAMTVARLELTGGAAVTQNLEFLNGVNFTLTAYTLGDWNGTATAGTVITSADATTWGFVNPASMVVSYINVQDSNATNVITATDNCTDGTGNTNWTFS